MPGIRRRGDGAAWGNAAWRKPHEPMYQRSVAAGARLRGVTRSMSALVRSTLSRWRHRLPSGTASDVAVRQRPLLLTTDHPVGTVPGSLTGGTEMWIVTLLSLLLGAGSLLSLSWGDVLGSVVTILQSVITQQV